MSLDQTINVKINALVKGLREVQKLQGELKVLERASGKTLSVNTSATERGLGRVINLLGLFSGRMGGATQRAEQFTSATGLQLGALGKLGIILGTLATLLGVAGAGLFAVTKKASDAGSEIFDASQKLNFMAETLSALKNLAEASGSSFESLNAPLGIFDKNVVAAQEHGSEMSKTFKSLNIDVADNETALRGAFKALNDLEGSEKQTTLALQIFGKSGKDVLGVIKETNGDLDAAIDRYRKFGTLIGTEAAQKADKFGDKLTQVQQRLAGVTNEVGFSLMPTFEKALDSIDGWLERNKDNFVRWANTIIETIQSLAATIGPIIAGLIDALQAFNALMKLLKTGDGSNATVEFSRAANDILPIAKTLDDADKERRLPQVNAGDGTRNIGKGFFRRLGARVPGKIPGAGGKGGGKGGGRQKPGEPEDTFDSSLSLFRAQLDAQFTLLKDALDREARLIDEKLEDRLVSIREFYAEQERIQTEAVDKEIAKLKGLQFAEDLRHNHALDKIKGDEHRKKITEDQANAKRIIEENKHKAETVQLEERLTILARERSAINPRNTRAEDAAETERLQELNEEISNFLDQVNELNGRTSQTVIRAVNDQLGPLLEKVIEEQGADSPLAELIQQFIDLVTSRAQIDELVGRANRVGQEFDTRVAEIQARVAPNILSQARAQREVNALQKEYADRQLVILRQALAIAQQAKDGTQITAIRGQIAEMERLKNEVRTFGQILKDTAINTAVNGLVNLFTDIATGAKTAKEAVLDFVRSFLAALQQLIIQMIVVKILQIALGMFGGGGGGVSGGSGAMGAFKSGFGGYMADGGPIDGPGTETSDSILAWLSKGEFVAPAKAVRFYGLEFFERLRNLSLPRMPAFATGGLVGLASNIETPDSARNTGLSIGKQSNTIVLPNVRDASTFRNSRQQIERDLGRMATRGARRLLGGRD